MLHRNPARIISLLASASEIVCELGLRDHLVGISHECDFPEDIKSLPVLSRPKIDPKGRSLTIDRQVRSIAEQGLSVYQIDTGKLKALQPDLIVTQDQCEVCAVSLKDVEQAVCALMMKQTRVCSLNPNCLEDIMADFGRVGRAAGVPERAETLASSVRKRLEIVQTHTAKARERPRVVCVEWLDPPMIAGGWIPELVTIAGGEPLIVTEASHFATVGWNDILAADPDIVVIMPCGFTINQTLRELKQVKKIAAHLRKLRAVASGRCYVSDGNAYFNRPGPRIADSAEILAEQLHPNLHPTWRQRFHHAYTTWH